MASGSGISFGGLASGLDSQAIIQTLVNLERRPITLLQQQKTNFNRQIDLFGTFETRLNSLQTSLENLRDEDSFKKFNASTERAAVVTASASGNALGGVYDVSVKQLAQQTRLSSQGYADLETTTVGSGTFQITVGDTTTDITLDSGEDTLNDLKDAINSSDAEVRAEIVNVGGSEPYKLVISANESGLDNAVTLDASGLSGGTQALSFTEIQSAQDAIFDLNGITDLQRSSNTLTDVIEGVTLNLFSVSEGNETDGYTATTVTISLDRDAMAESARGFVNAYNDVARFFRDQGRFDADEATSAPLFGDFTLRSIQSSLRSRFSEVFENDGSFNSLASLGFKTKSDGFLEFDSADYKDALETDLGSVADLFQADGSIGDQLVDYLDTVTDTADGLIKSRRDNIRRRIGALDDRIASNERRIETYEASLTRQYASLETLVSSLQVQGQSVGAIFGFGS
ncbi:MAG: flagellar filament capping protein FliD [Planctomycetota bacterium]